MRNSVEHMLHTFHDIRKIYGREFAHMFQEDNFSPNEIDVLIFLYNNPSINTSMQLRVCLNVSKALICRSVDSLMKRGLLITYTDSHDKRIQRLQLSEQATPFIHKMRQLKETIGKQLLENISPEALQQMEQTLQQIQKNVEKNVRRDDEQENKSEAMMIYTDTLHT